MVYTASVQKVKLGIEPSMTLPRKNAPDCPSAFPQRHMLHDTVQMTHPRLCRKASRGIKTRLEDEPLSIWYAKSFEDGLLKVVNAGGDADTNAAVACAILGVKFGFRSIPQEYVDGLIYKEQLDEFVENLSKICIK